MANSRNPLRFDHREIAVIFSLFVFVSLLMFTVGILVGKGLAQARYESLVAAEAERIKASAKAPFSPENVQAHSTGSSVNYPAHAAAAPAAQVHAEKAEEHAEPSEQGEKQAKLELVPAEQTLGGLKEPAIENKELTQVLANPKLRNIFEADDGPKRAPASQLPKSFTSGAFTVQVGSYPAEKDAQERVEALKKLGYPHAFFSTKEIQGKNDTWFRVWLGYFPDETQARLAGQNLKSRGEVKDYLVREADKAAAKN